MKWKVISLALVLWWSGTGFAQSAERWPKPEGQRHLVLLHLDSDHDATSLEEAAADVASGWGGQSYATGLSLYRTVCVAPCDSNIEPQRFFRLSGLGLTPSGTFAIPTTAERVTVKARMGSQAGFWGGFVLAAVGVGATIAGVTMGALAASHGDTVAPSILTASAGVAIGVGGLLLLVNNLSHYEVVPEPSQSVVER